MKRFWRRIETASRAGRRLPGYGLMLALLAGLAAPAQAEISSEWSEGLNSRVRLVAGEVTPRTGQPGGGLYAGVEIELAEGWKTYWRRPGDAGIPPQFDWSRSENVAAQHVLYPAPWRHADAAGHSIGYKKTVTFPVWVKPKEGGGSLTLRLTLDYAVCAELCIPARAELSLFVPTTVAAALGPAPGLQASLDQVPVEAPGTPDAPRVTSVRVERSGEEPRLVVDVAHPGGSDGMDLFVEGPADWYLTVPTQTDRQADGTGGQTVTYAIPLDAMPKDAKPAGTALFFTIRDGERAFSQSWILE